jgi:hypothetical protein
MSWGASGRHPMRKQRLYIDQISIDIYNYISFVAPIATRNTLAS